jgi:hypothetical protein
MKKLLFIALLCMSTAAMAEDASAPATPATPAAASGGNADKPKMTFEEHKAKVLDRIGKGIAKMQEKQSCVQAATTPEALKTCLPRMGEGKWRHKGDKDNDGDHDEGHEDK